VTPRDHESGPALEQGAEKRRPVPHRPGREHGRSRRTSSRSHSTQRSCSFFSQEGQKLRPRQEKATTTLLRHSPHHSRAKPVLEQAALEELPQDPLDHRPQRAVAPGEALRPDPQQLLEVALDERVERRLARAPRPVDPASDLHAQPEAGGRVAGGTGRRLRCSGLRRQVSVAAAAAEQGPGAGNPGQGRAAGRRTADALWRGLLLVQPPDCPSTVPFLGANRAKAVRRDSGLSRLLKNG
jgi:hypothetical protein